MAQFRVRWFHTVVALLIVAIIVTAVWRWHGEIGTLIGTKQGRVEKVEWLRRQIETFGVWAPLAVIGLCAAQVVIAPLPGQVIAMASGFMFNTFLGGLYAVVGGMIGSLGVLWVTRRWGRPFVARIIPPAKLARLDDLAARRGKAFFFIILLIPFGPHDLTVYAMGLTLIPMGSMLVLILLSRIPGAFVASWMGAHALTDLNPVWLIVVVGGALVIGLVYVRWGEPIEDAMMSVVRRVLGRSAAPAPTLAADPDPNPKAKS